MTGRALSAPDADVTGGLAAAVAAQAVDRSGQDGVSHLFQRFPGANAVTGRALGRANRQVARRQLIFVAAKTVADLRADMIHLFEWLPGESVVAVRTLQILNVNMSGRTCVGVAFIALGHASGDGLIVIEIIDLVPGAGGVAGGALLHKVVRRAEG